LSEIDYLNTSAEHRKNATGRVKIEVFGDKFFSVPLCPPQIPGGLASVRTCASAVSCPRLTRLQLAKSRREEGGLKWAKVADADNFVLSVANTSAGVLRSIT
jgi:hypothetical protein